MQLHSVRYVAIEGSVCLMLRAQRLCVGGYFGGSARQERLTRCGRVDVPFRIYLSLCAHDLYLSITFDRLVGDFTIGSGVNYGELYIIGDRDALKLC